MGMIPNPKQKILLYVMSALVGLFFLNPPYLIRRNYTDKIVGSGYGCIFKLPDLNDANFSTLINIPFLLVEVAGILIVGLLLYFALNKSHPQP